MLSTKAWQSDRRFRDILFRYVYLVKTLAFHPSRGLKAYSQFVHTMRLHIIAFSQYTGPSVKTERLEVKALIIVNGASPGFPEYSATNRSVIYIWVAGVCSFLDDNLPIWYRMCACAAGLRAGLLMVPSRESFDDLWRRLLLLCGPGSNGGPGAWVPAQLRIKRPERLESEHEHGAR